MYVAIYIAMYIAMYTNTQKEASDYAVCSSFSLFIKQDLFM